MDYKFIAIVKGYKILYESVSKKYIAYNCVGDYVKGCDTLGEMQKWLEAE